MKIRRQIKFQSKEKKSKTRKNGENEVYQEGKGKRRCGKEGSERGEAAGD